jgi:hypothetical protein
MSMQKLNCAVGDLAIVFSAEQTDNLGQIVKVLGPQTGKPFTLQGPGHVWQVKAVSGRKTLTYVFREDGRRVRHIVGPAPDCRLRPISGLGPGDFEQEVNAPELRVAGCKRAARPAVASQAEVGR